MAITTPSPNVAGFIPCRESWAWSTGAPCLNRTMAVRARISATETPSKTSIKIVEILMSLNETYQAIRAQAPNSMVRGMWMWAIASRTLAKFAKPVSPATPMNR